MTSFPKLALIAIISRVYNLKSVDGFTTSRAESSINLLNNKQVTKQLSGVHTSSSSSSSSLMAGKRPGNPFQSFFGDVASSIVGGGGGGGSNEALDQQLSEIESLSSWDDVKSQLQGKQTDEEKAFRSNVEKGIGRASPLNKIRLFDENNKEEDVRVVLYRDSASWCPYCQKVWMTLEEKRIPYRIEKVNMRCYGEKPPSFLRMQPSGNIPVAVIDGTIYNQSNDIMYALEQIFPESKKLLPPSDNEQLRMKAQSLLRLERTLFSAWMYWLTGNARSKQNFISVLKEVDNELSKSVGGDFFLGQDVSIVDFMFAPFLERMAASMIFFKGYKIRVSPGEKTEFPAVNKWFDAMEKLESYQLTKGDYYSHCWDLPPQLGGCTYENGGEPFEKCINGERLLDGSRGSWELPLVPHMGGVEPDWTWCGDEDAAKREAVERLSFNSKNIVAFAARGAGKKGMPPYMAALSDPNATPNESVKASVDACLRAISLALINDNEANANLVAEEIISVFSNAGGKEHVQNVVASLVYLRDRIGVPRDMRLPAARQLRARLNWMIGKLMFE